MRIVSFAMPGPELVCPRGEKQKRGFLRSQIEGGVRDSAPGFSYFVAKFYALLGEKEQALSWLEKSCENKDFLVAFVKAEPILMTYAPSPVIRPCCVAWALLSKQQLGQNLNPQQRKTA
jgi:hypothetical protein